MTPEIPHKILLPPNSRRFDFLPPEFVADLLAYALSHESEFEPSGVGPGAGGVNPEMRVSSILRKLGPFKKELRTRFAPLAPALTAELNATPFETSSIEIEVVAHNDGAFYSRHIDTRRNGIGEAIGSQRVLSGVYYFHASPKNFTGGALRLHEFVRRPDGAFIDIEPLHNSLVFFPSWAPHEVRPISCPSKRFIDSRFAINCWFRRTA